MYITFDKNSHTPVDDETARVEFYGDQAMTQLIAIRSGQKGTFEPFLAPSSRLFVRTIHDMRASGFAKQWWGWECKARGMTGVRWSSEADVLATPSLEWGMWLLQFLVGNTFSAR